MITLHRAESTVFASLGLGVISDMIGGVVVEELNGIYELTIKYPTTGVRYKDFQLRRIIYAKPNPYSKPQPFRIYSMSKPINRVVTINACHISYDLTGYPVNEFKGTSPSDTMLKLKSNSQVQHNFTFNSTVTTTGEVNVDGPRTTRSVLGNNILSAYGGEYEFDNFMVYHRTSRGMNRGVAIRYGKNMTDLNQEENISNVYTGVYPYWEGTDVNTNKRILLKLPERIIKTPGKYSFTRILPLDLSQEFTEKPTEEKLREKANKYIEDNKIGIPTVALTMTFIQLSKSTENSNFKVLDQVELGDTVSVYFEELGVDATARCIKTTYNLCTGRYDSVDLGDAKSNLSVGISDSKKETMQAIEKQKVFFDAEVGNIKIDIAHIDQAIIDKADINWVSANYAHLVNGYIDIAQIKQGSIGTAQIGDAEITIAKIQNAFVDSLVAAQGKFNSAHIGVLTSDNIDANTITAEYIKGVVIDAINLNVSGKISADRIDVGSLKVDEIDAGKITSGTLDANRIGANSIAASKLRIVDFTNYATIYQSSKNPDLIRNLDNRDHMLSTGYIPASDWGDKEEFTFDLQCKTVDQSTTIHISAAIWVKYTDNSTSYFLTKISDAESAREWVKRSVTVRVTPTIGKIPVSFMPVLTIPETPPDPSTNNWQVKQVVVRRKNAGKLIVDGSIQSNHLSSGSVTADKIDSEAITAELLKVNVIQAINLTTFKIDAKNINTDGLVVNGSLIAGDISADNIQSQVISAINSYTGTAKIRQAQIETLKIGNANVIDLDASKIKSGKIAAEFIDAANLQIASGNVTGTFTANKIVGGTFDAGTMNVVNLKAESITTGSLTIDADNKQRNTGFIKDLSNWEFIRDDTASAEVDLINKFENVNTVHITRTGMTEASRYYFYSGKGVIPCGEGETFTASCYFNTSDKNLIDAPVTIGVWFYNSEKKLVGYDTTDIVFENNKWIRFTSTYKAPVGTSSVALVIAVDKNADFNIGKPMLSKGSIVPIWKPHVDEQISDGGITGDKIANESVTSGKLNIQELFVGNNAFINQLRAFEINASQITTGKISGERIELSGLISFEALSTDLQNVFDTTENKVYINGGMIAANSITAQSIDLKSGLTVTGPDNTITFSIASDGTVTANALLQSGNFDEANKTGYQLSPSGTAILNQALVRGRVELPNAGMTNDYDMDQTTGRNLILNSDKLYDNTDYMIAEYTTSQDWVTGEKYTILLRGELEDEKNQIFAAWLNGATYRVARLNKREDGLYYATFTAPEITPGCERMFRIYGYPKSTTPTRNKIYYIKVEKGINPEIVWTAAPEDNNNPVRIWAGKSYDQRDSAPFKVMQNGDVYAKNAILEGVLYGRVDSGYVNIDQKQLSIVDDTSIPNKEYIRMNDLVALFDVDIIFGNETDRMFNINKELREAKFSGTHFVLEGSNTTVNYETGSGVHGGLNFINSESEARHVVRHGKDAIRSSTLIFDAQGSRSSESDFTFTRKNYSEDASVLVEGFLKIKKDLKSTSHNIEMRSVPNEGWGFYAG